MYWKRLLIRSSLILIGLVVLLISLIPTGLRIGLAELAKRQGATDALIDDIDLNPLTGRFSIEGVYLRFKDAPPLTLARFEAAVSMRELFDQRIVIENLLLDGLQADIQRDDKGILWINGWTPDSLPPGTSSTGEKPQQQPLAWAIESLELQNLRLRYREPSLEQPLLLQSLKLEKLYSWRPQQATGLDFDIELQQQARLQGQFDLRPLQQDPALKGKLQLTRLPLESYRKFLPPSIGQLAARLDLDLQLDLQLPQADPQRLQGQVGHQLRLHGLQLAYAPLTLDLQQLDWQADVRLQGVDRLQVHKGKLTLEKLKLDDRERKSLLARFDRLAASLDLDLQLPQADPQRLQGRLGHQLQLQGLQLAHAPLTLDLQQLDWQADARLQGADRLQVQQGKLALEKLKLDDRERKFLLARFDRLLIDGFDLQTDQSIAFKDLQLDSVEALTQTSKAPLLQLAGLSIHRLRLPADKSIEIAEIGLTAPRIDIEIDEQQKLPALEALQQSLKPLQSTDPAQAPASQQDTESEQEVEKPSSKESTPDFSVGLIQLTQPGQVDFLDRSVSPHYKTRLQLNALKIRNLQRKQAADFELQARQGEYTQIQLQGTGLLLEPQQQLKLKTVIKQLDLPPLTSYASKATGYGVKSGTLDSDIDLKIEKNQIDALVKLDIDALDVIETNPETAAELNSAAGISIDLALSTLKDDDGRLRLELPVKGDLENPDFRLQKVFNKALGKAMQGATLSYLKHTLQPFGSLITLYQLGKAAANHVALPSLAFQPGSLELAEGQQALLDKVIGLMKKRPALKIKACGIASPSDLPVLQQQLEKPVKKGGKPKPVEPEKLQQALFDLAKQRAAWVKKQLVAAGIAPERVLNCLSRVETEKKDLGPQVELLL